MIKNNKYLLYINERFPIPGVVLYAGSLFWVSYSFGNLFARGSWNLQDFILGIMLLVMIFLHLRIFDEHKDFNKDKIAYPERMLSKGNITLGDLKKILIPVVIAEALLALYLGFPLFIAWLASLIWTLLMLKEFFAPIFLNRRISLYLVSHQLLVPLMMAIPLSLSLQIPLIQMNEVKRLLVLFAGAMCLTVTYELGRKTWSKDRENENADSYTREWGIHKTILVTLVISFSGFLLFSWLMIDFEINPVYIIINAVMLLLLVIAEVNFFNNQTNRNSKIIELSGAVYMLGTFINTSIAFTLYLQ